MPLIEMKQKTNPSNNRLGRGLTSLLGEIEALPPGTPGSGPDNTTSSILNVRTEDLQRNPDQPRQRFDTDSIAELSQSIALHGILQPIIVRKAPDGSHKYEIIAGERRWRAAQEAGLEEVPVLIRTIDELTLLELGIIENVQREDLTPIEEAKAYKALIDRFGRTQASIADSVGKSRSHIANLLRLLNTSSKVQTYLSEGKLSAGHARSLLTIDESDEIADRVVSENWSVRDLEKYAQNPSRKSQLTTPAKDPTKDVDVAALEADLSRKLGLDIQIAQGQKGGIVKIKYTSLEQLDDVCRKLSS